MIAQHKIEGLLIQCSHVCVLKKVFYGTFPFLNDVFVVEIFPAADFFASHASGLGILMLK